MEVILLDEMKSLGSRGDFVKVADGYARNYLIPQGIAVKATRGNRRQFEEEEKLRSVRENKLRRQAERVSGKLAGVSCTIAVPAGEDDRLFGSITAQDISSALREQGVEVDKRKIVLEEPLRALGVYTVVVRIFQDIQTKIKVWVVRE
ncbi:MAG: 50S ribosomal protein L9 [Candidatus Eisenbacteria sp.]|nr:50S ribosomal protein L9 [Candidatus Eisenbacteria bacterium]